MNEISDDRLMTEVREGREAVLGELFERHHAALYRFCLRMTGNRQASEDLVQDAFMKILQHRKSYRPGTAFKPWMYRIARNACVDHLRRDQRSPHVPELEQESAGDTPTAERQAEGREFSDLLGRALLRLPVERREVLLLSRFEMKSYQEIAETTGSTRAAVKVRAHRAVKQLRQVFQQLAGEAAS